MLLKYLTIGRNTVTEHNYFLIKEREIIDD